MIISCYERLSIDLSTAKFGKRISLSLSLLDKHRNRKGIALERVPFEPTRYFFFRTIKLRLFSLLPIIFFLLYS